MMADALVLTVPIFSTLCNEAFKLRRAVFITEQKVPLEEEFDHDDLTAHHLVAIIGGEVCGTLRVITMDEHIKIGRVAVSVAARGHGIASLMISQAMKDHGATRGNRFYLTAQTDKVGLYERFGFKAYGDEFLDGGMPHLAMKTY
ncbi:GNAT family N-acetyltransferase [Rhizobium sp. 18055]|uniref:GNAT family N-acetyltransferase n=1 Tax=Rhizobium sp. 18055 TaxID=2681403 RepID=UPI00190FB8A7|nr:GNAT family N-acetyltransferase [Rhizobium sp. 18055]